MGIYETLTMPELMTQSASPLQPSWRAVHIRQEWFKSCEASLQYCIGDLIGYQETLPWLGDACDRFCNPSPALQEDHHSQTCVNKQPQPVCTGRRSTLVSCGSNSPVGLILEHLKPCICYTARGGPTSRQIAGETHSRPSEGITWRSPLSNRPLA